MPVRGGNNGRQEGKHKILEFSVDVAPVEVPPDVEVGWIGGGVESRNEVGSGVDVPRNRADESCDEMNEVPPDSSKDEMVAEISKEVDSPKMKCDDSGFPDKF